MILANHPSLLDVVFLVGHVKNANCIVKHGLATNPFTRGPVANAGYITNDESFDMFDRAADALRNGETLIVFPEGTRTPPDAMPQFHRGACAIALRGAQVVTPVVIRIETESDIERLRQVALLQQTENARLHKRLLELTQELAVARGEDAILAIQQELSFLKEQIDARNRELFGASSEKRSRDKSGDAASNGTTERTGHGRRDQPKLPMVDVVHVLDEADRACPKCGGRARAG